MGSKLAGLQEKSLLWGELVTVSGHWLILGRQSLKQRLRNTEM